MPNSAKRPTLDQLIGKNFRRLRGTISQDAVARQVRAVGLPWSRSTVAALELGTKTLDAAELVLLSLSTGFPVADLVQGDGLVQMLPNVAMSPRAIRRTLGSQEQLGREDIVFEVDAAAGQEIVREAIAAGTLGSKDTDLRDPSYVAKLDLGRHRLEAYERVLPRISNIQLFTARDAARGEAEMKAARRLKLDDPVLLAVAAQALWNRSFTEERDARVAGAARTDATPRSVQALRGHVTRQLIQEIEPVVRKAT